MTYGLCKKRKLYILYWNFSVWALKVLFWCINRMLNTDINVLCFLIQGHLNKFHEIISFPEFFFKIVSLIP